MTSLLEGAKALLKRGSDDIGPRLAGLETATQAARGRLDDALVDDAAGVVQRAAGRLRLSAEHTVVAIAGAIRGIDPDEIDGEDVRIRRRARRLTRLGIGALAVALGVALVGWVGAITATNRATNEARRAVIRPARDHSSLPCLMPTSGRISLSSDRKSCCASAQALSMSSGTGLDGSAWR